MAQAEVRIRSISPVVGSRVRTPDNETAIVVGFEGEVCNLICDGTPVRAVACNISQLFFFNGPQQRLEVPQGRKAFWLLETINGQIDTRGYAPDPRLARDWLDGLPLMGLRTQMKL